MIDEIKLKSCKRYNDPGHTHELTFNCFHKKKFLSRARTRQWFLESLENARVKYEFHLWAYVIMPEHVHLLIWPTTPTYSISQILIAMKRPVSLRAFNYARQESPATLDRMKDSQPNGKVHFRFWQRGGGYDRNLTEPKTIWAAIDYIHANPVRKNLCKCPTDWIWSSAVEHNSPGTGVLRMNLDSLPRTDLG